ncbi:MAG TPA: prolyl oligopeptidase family serine peptidase [Gaiellaceae bacterium]|nr:prolyl oligopeptidase family serine peptidase [Gaiellaceae bacterium]
MKMLIILVALVIGVPVATALSAAAPATTRAMRFFYRAHDGRMRPAWLLLPSTYDGGSIPLVISPHGRGVSAADNVRFWGNLPGEGDFAVVNPGGEGRRLHQYSWGDPGQIADLARMPAIVDHLGVHVDPHRVYAIGGSMGGQETLLLVAKYPKLLAGAAAFDPDTNMALRYRDFASMRYGPTLQQLARDEMGGTPSQVPAAYRVRSPNAYVHAIAFSGVPLQIYWSVRDRIITDQFREAGLLAADIQSMNPAAKLWDFKGSWDHTAEMRADRRLPRALVRFGLLPQSDVPPLPGPRPTTASPPLV